MKKITLQSSLLVMLFVAGCGSGKDKSIVAEVNGQVITSSQLAERLNRTTEKIVNPEVQEQRKTKAVGNIVEEEIVLQAALKEGLLKKSERLRREVMREYFQDKLAGDKELPTEDELKKYYDTYRKDLDQVHLRQIVIKTGGSKDAALKKANEVLAKARSKDKSVSFSELASQYSEDNETKARGGDMGFIPLEKLTPEINAVVAKLDQSRSISDVVKTDAGYVIIQLLEDRRGLENNKMGLQMSLGSRKKKELMSELLKDLHKNASVKTYPQAIAKVSVPAPDPVPAASPK